MQDVIDVRIEAAKRSIQLVYDSYKTGKVRREDAEFLVNEVKNDLIMGLNEIDSLKNRLVQGK